MRIHLSSSRLIRSHDLVKPSPEIAKDFSFRIQMVKYESFLAFVVFAQLTPSALIIESLLLQILSPFVNEIVSLAEMTTKPASQLNFFGTDSIRAFHMRLLYQEIVIADSLLRYRCATPEFFTPEL